MQNESARKIAIFVAAVSKLYDSWSYVSAVQAGMNGWFVFVFA